MVALLELLSDCKRIAPFKQREILVEIHKMHLDVLE